LDHLVFSQKKRLRAVADTCHVGKIVPEREEESKL